MATEDGFQPDRAPLFLSGQAEEAGPPGIAKGWDLATISSRILKASILAVAATAIGIAILSIGDPATLVANMTDRWVDRPALQPKADPSTPTVQAIAGAPDVPAELAVPGAAPASASATWKNWRQDSSTDDGSRRYDSNASAM